MADKKISELPFGQLDSSSIIPIVNNGTSIGSTYLYYNETTFGIEAVRLVSGNLL